MWEHVKEGAKKFKKTSVLALVLTTVEIISQTLIPLVIATLIDDGILQKNFDHILKTGLLMIGLSLLGLICGIIAARLAAYSATGFAAVIRFNLFDKIQKFSFSNIDKFSTGDLVTRMTTDVQNLKMAYQMSMRVAVRAPFKLIIALFMAILINGQLSLIFVGIILFLTILLGYIIFHAMKLFDQVFDQYGNLNRVIRENIRGARVVKAFVREDFEEKKFYKEAKKLFDLFVNAQDKVALNEPAMNLAGGFAIIFISWIGAKLIVGSSLTPGELTTFIAYVGEILIGLMMLSMLFVVFMMAITSGKRIAQVQREEIDIINPEDPIYEVKDGSIEFSNVSFSHDKTSENLALKDINIRIESGETIGILGPTGSGKSALVNLIPRLYDINSGTLKVGGVDVRKYDIETLRDEVSVVLQKNTLFSGTIIENLRWGNEDASFEECVEAAKIAQAHNFIMKEDGEYEGRVEQGGSNFSGGQKQRLCIARALVKNPKVLIFDDSTSAVDTDTDRRIQEGLKNSKPEVTKIIISQRISSLEKADKILLLENGQVNGFDNHENLLKSNEIYREIYESQGQSGPGDFDLEASDE